MQILRLNLFVLIFLLSLLHLGCSKQKILSFNKLINSRWTFRSNGGYYYNMTILKESGEVFIDGKVSDNEKYWIWNGNYLTFVDSNRQPSTRFLLQQHIDGIWYLTGQHIASKWLNTLQEEPK